MNYVERTMFAPTSLIAQVRAMAGVFPGVPKPENFLPLAFSPTGQPPATHFGVSGWMDEQLAASLPVTTVDAETNEVSVSEVNVEPLVATANAMGVPITVAQLNGILGACDVSLQPLETAMARLGIQSIAPPVESDPPTMETK